MCLQNPTGLDLREVFGAEKEAGFWKSMLRKEILTEGFDLLKKSDSLGTEKRLEKLLWGLGSPGEGKETAVVRRRLKMHTDE